MNSMRSFKFSPLEKSILAKAMEVSLKDSERFHNKALPKLQTLTKSVQNKLYANKALTLNEFERLLVSLDNTEKSDYSSIEQQDYLETFQKMMRPYKISIVNKEPEWFDEKPIEVSKRGNSGIFTIVAFILGVLCLRILLPLLLILCEGGMLK